MDADGTATKCPFLKMSKWDVSVSYSSNTVSTYCYYNKLTSMKQLRNHTLFSLHIGESGFPNPRNFCQWNTEFGKIVLLESGIGESFLVESGIKGFAVRNTAQGIHNHTND